MLLWFPKINKPNDISIHFNNFSSHFVRSTIFTMTRQSVKLVQLGLTKYKKGLHIQNSFARQHLDFLAGKSHTPGENVLMVLEHPPVYTVGLRDKDYDSQEENRLRGLGADFHRTNRGGLVTFHGPGQLVAYPILNLKNFNMGIRKFICGLEKAVINTCGRLGIRAETTADTGVWVENRKICALGVHASRFVTTHGLALNCDINLTWFKHIVPCGLVGKEVTSLSAETGVLVTVQDALVLFLEEFEKQFECNVKK